jgi:hypothetical protein
MIYWSGLKIPDGPWSNETTKEDWIDAATGYNCYMRRSGVYAWCGYVSVPSTHYYYGFDTEDLPNNLGNVFGLHLEGRAGIIGGSEPDEWYFGRNFGNGLVHLDAEYRDTNYVKKEIGKLCLALKSLERGVGSGTPTYNMVDAIITELFDEPDPSCGMFVLDHGNLQAFAARVLDCAKDRQDRQGDVL